MINRITLLIIILSLGFILSINISPAEENDEILPEPGDRSYQYLPGDANMYKENWPPLTVGGDVTFLVNYFRLLPNAPPCIIDGFWASADANGDCQVTAGDVTRLVKYFRGQVVVKYCLDYPPAWFSRDDLPAIPPPGWPNCE